MTSPVFESFAQNGEDVVLWRALKHINGGRYIDVGANDPSIDSISRAFYDRGWRGITVEPVPYLAAKHRVARPGDLMFETAVTDSGDDTVTLHVIDATGLSTLVDDVASMHSDKGLDVHDMTVSATELDAILSEAGWQGLDIHFMTVDVEGVEASVLRSVDLRRWRPWVLVIEATRPRSSNPTQQFWEGMVLDAGYEFCLFDGLSRYYVAEERADELRADLSYPACALDNYEARHTRELRTECEHLAQQVEHAKAEMGEWRAKAITSYMEGGRPAVKAEVDLLQRELLAMRKTLSWRVTWPLRSAKSVLASRRPA